MIVNIVDERKNKYRFHTVNAVVEAAWHDNSVKDGDRVTDKRGPDYDERKHISVAGAIAWAGSFVGSVTLFLYDKGDGIE